MSDQTETVGQRRAKEAAQLAAEKALATDKTFDKAVDESIKKESVGEKRAKEARQLKEQQEKEVTTNETEPNQEIQTNQGIQTNQNKSAEETKLKVQQAAKQVYTKLTFDPSLPTILSIGDNGFQEIIDLKKSILNLDGEYQFLHTGAQKELTNLYGITTNEQLKNMQIVFGVTKKSDKPKLFTFLETPCKFDGYNDIINALQRRADTLGESINFKNERIKSKTDRARLEWIKNTIQRLKDIKYTDYPPCVEPTIAPAPAPTIKEGCPCLEDLNLLRDLISAIAILLGNAHPEIEKQLKNIPIETLLNRAAKNNIKKKDTISKLIEILSQVSTVQKQNVSVQSPDIDKKIQDNLRQIYSTLTGKEFQGDIIINDVLKVLSELKQTASPAVVNNEKNALQNKINNLQEQINNKEQQVINLQNQIQKMQIKPIIQNTGVGTNIEQISTEVQTNDDAEIAGLKKDLETAKNEIALLKEQLEEKKQLEDELDNKIKDLGINTENFNKQITELNMQIQTVESEKIQAQENLNTINEQINTLENEKSQQTKKISELEQQLNQKNDEITEITLQKNELNNQINNLQNQININPDGEEKSILQQELDNNKTELAEKNSIIANLETEIERIKSEENSAFLTALEELQNLEGKKEKAQNELNAANSKIMELTEQLNKVGSEKTTAIDQGLQEKESEIKRKNTFILEQNNKIGELENEKIKLQNEIEELKKISGTQEQIEKMNKDMDELQKKFDEIQTDRDAVISENNSLKEQIKEIETLKNQIAEKDGEYIEKSFQNSTQISELEEQIRELETQKMINQSKIEQLTTSKKTAENAKQAAEKQLTNEKIKLEQQIRNIQTKFQTTMKKETKQQLQNLLTMILVNPSLANAISKTTTTNEVSKELCGFLQYMLALVEKQYQKLQNVPQFTFKNGVEKNEIIKQIIDILQKFFIKIADKNELINQIPLDKDYSTLYDSLISFQGDYSSYDKYGYLESYKLTKDGDKFKISKDVKDGISLTRLSVLLIVEWYDILQQKIIELGCLNKNTAEVPLTSSVTAPVAPVLKSVVDIERDFLTTDPLKDMEGKITKINNNTKLDETKIFDIFSLFIKSELYKVKFIKDLNRPEIKMRFDNILSVLNIFLNNLSKSDLNTVLNKLFEKINKISDNNYKTFYEKYIDNFINKINIKQTTVPSTILVQPTQYELLKIINDNINKPHQGLPQCGNSCYLNSVLQMLSYVPEFVQELSNSSNNSEKKVYEIFEKLYGNQTITRNSIESSIDSIREIAGFKQKGRQEDASEFLIQLLEKFSTANYFNYKLNESITCIGNNTPVIFKDNNYKILNVELTDKKSISKLIDDQLKLQEKMEGNNNVEVCRKNGIQGTGVAIKQINYEIPPENNYLIIALKRFNTRGNKNNNLINVDNYISIDNVSYFLYGVIPHLGITRDSGHYIFIKKTEDNNGIIYDDSSVNKINDFTTNNKIKQVYIAIYKRIEKRPRLNGGSRTQKLRVQKLKTRKYQKTKKNHNNRRNGH